MISVLHVIGLVAAGVLGAATIISLAVGVLVFTGELRRTVSRARETRERRSVSQRQELEAVVRLYSGRRSR